MARVGGGVGAGAARVHGGVVDGVGGAIGSGRWRVEAGGLLPAAGEAPPGIAASRPGGEDGPD
ncbi:hypothetical protein BST65_00425 [Bradyrhizobium canariense]|nr:hypothetical protein BST65_00425 [Bradyrhizobium canariense]